MQSTSLLMVLPTAPQEETSVAPCLLLNTLPTLHSTAGTVFMEPTHHQCAFNITLNLGDCVSQLY